MLQYLPLFFLIFGLGLGSYFIGRAHGLKEAADLYESERAMRDG